MSATAYISGKIRIFFVPLHSLSVYTVYMRKSDWRHTNERESDRSNLGVKQEAIPIQTTTNMARHSLRPPCQALQNPPWLRHRPIPQTIIVFRVGSPHRRFSVSRPPSACGRFALFRSSVSCIRQTWRIEPAAPPGRGSKRV